MSRHLLFAADPVPKGLGSNVSAAIRSVAACRPQEVNWPPCPSSFERTSAVPMQQMHTIASIRIRMAGLLRNRRPNTVQGIPNAPLFISCLRITSTAMSVPTNNASSRNRVLYVLWLCALWRSSLPVDGSREASREFAATNAARSIFWRSLAGQGISVRAVRPNAPSCSPKNSPPRSSPQFHTVTGPFRSRGSCAACSSASAHC